MDTNYGERPGLTVEPILHVRTKCGEKDLRCYRSVWSRRKGSDATVCGAPVDAHTLGRKTGEAMLRLPHWRAQLCPACADKLAALAQARGSRDGVHCACGNVVGADGVRCVECAR